MRRSVAVSSLAAAVAGTALAAGSGPAHAQVEDGTYEFCVQTRYGSSVEPGPCQIYRVVGDELIGPAGTPLALTHTPTGGYAEIPPVSRLVLIKTRDGYRAINTVLGVPVASSTLNPVDN
ncbi:hypothetical protein [Gordonia aquimaris]|uniref:Carboxypeptidase regulatory-like domain-containing protein n=1 Tax=Gordonia aquimaris TaxID=2984863 RepID=A0A9X3D479_9ACTN|nr:hypothetical protein [Gordonia aquimaris]MCX2964703.1 hypothetical protein [Gordonia aquimaris]